MSWADIAFRFGPAEYVALLALLLAALCAAAPQPLHRSIGMTVMGLLLGTLGEDPWGEARNALGLPLEPETLAVLVTCVALFALVVPQIAQHAQRHHAPPSGPAHQGRAVALWQTTYLCLGFWPASGAFLVTSSAWALRPAWAVPLATACCGLLWAWYEVPPELLGVCAVVALMGLVCLQLGCPVVPLLAGMLASPMLEQNLQRGLMLARGEWVLLVWQRPVAAALVGLGLLILALRGWCQARHWRQRQRSSMA